MLMESVEGLEDSLQTGPPGLTSRAAGYRGGAPSAPGRKLHSKDCIQDPALLLGPGIRQQSSPLPGSFQNFQESNREAALSLFASKIYTKNI